MRPKRTDDKYWIGTRDFNHIRYERDLEDYIIDLENETQQLRKHSVIGSFCECRTKKPMLRCMDDRTYCADCGNVIKQYDR